ncbi:energy-coupling factor transporter transmembrane component T family protein [Kribbella sp. CA-253562]|uniref:energy-coupling factor transporter transmembrane component T family protein n=1 Tax=Kribbella sp. CA-253562 TaxID=3239942 RepID=UPI003D90159D
MTALYRPGRTPLHRLPAGPKALGFTVVVLAVSLLPTSWEASVAALAVAAATYLFLGPGAREFITQLYGLRWILLIVFAGQLIFSGLMPAATNTARVGAAILLATLVMLTTRVTDLLAALERGLQPLRRLGVDPQRASLLFCTVLTTVPVLGRLALEVREAQRARGGRGIRIFAMTFTVVALKHADQLGEALAARGVD